MTLADDLSLPLPINQIRGVRTCGLSDWYCVSWCCEENSIYKVATNCLWQLSQYGACQTIISTEGPLCWGKVTLWVKCQLRFDCHFWKVLVWQWCHCVLSVLETRTCSSSWQRWLHPWCNAKKSLRTRLNWNTPGGSRVDTSPNPKAAGIGSSNPASGKAVKDEPMAGRSA